MSARGTAIDADALVLVAHGSRHIAGQQAMAELAVAVAERGRVPVHCGYLELSDPPATTVLDEVIAAGAERVVVVPAMLHAAGHSKSDVPAVVAHGRAAHRHVTIVYARPFGADHALLQVAQSRIADAGGTGRPLVLVSRGSSDPDANAEAYRVSRLVADMVGAPLVVPGFSGVTWPSVPEALDQLRRLGATAVTAFAWYLATGVLIERMAADFARFSAETGIDVVDAGYLGVGPEVADLVCQRAEEALAGRAVPNCDACAYRVPFPGLESRVGMVVGAGHSHLAAAHRHGAQHDEHHHHGGDDVAQHR